MQKIRVMLADDHDLVRDGLRVLINMEPDMEIVAEAKDGDEAWNLAQSIKPDVLLLDIAMPKMGCERVVKHLSTSYPEVKVIIVSVSMNEALVRQMRSLGAAGYIHKSNDFIKLSKAIRMVTHSDVFARSMLTEEIIDSELQEDEEGLTERDIELLTLAARGYSNIEIGKMMHLSVKTIESYKAKLGSKLGLGTRAAIVAYALKRGWLH